MPPESTDEPKPPGSRDAKAEAKAAKAYVKAQRPWYKKKRYVLSLGALLLVVVASASGGSGTDSTRTTPDSSASQSGNNPNENATPAEASGPTAKLPIQDGDWRLDSIRVKDDGLGDFGGTARVTYLGTPESGTNSFTVTVFVGGKDVAALVGIANAVEAGRAATVQLVSQDKFIGGPYKFDFQNDF